MRIACTAGRGLVGSAFALLLTAVTVTAAPAQSVRKCGAARDLMVQALEKANPGSSAESITEANELLKRATRLCAELGDAWYYRSVLETKLNRPRLSSDALEQAKMLGSEAMDEQLDPLHVAAPRVPEPGLPTGPASRWALIVGVGAFSDSSIAPLAHTVDDAKLFASVLEDRAAAGFAPDHVRTLLDGTATTANIRAGLNWIARSAKPQDLVIIYVATHGSARNADSVAGASYLITSDTKFGEDHDEDLLFGSALAMNDLVATVANRISARRTAIFIDTCYSGSTAASGHGESVSERDLKRFNEGAGRIVLTAARADQESRESNALGHGYFTWFLVQALRSPNKPTLGAVYDRIAMEVPERVAQDARPMHVTQNPVMSRSTPDTDFTLAPGGN